VPDDNEKVEQGEREQILQQGGLQNYIGRYIIFYSPNGVSTTIIISIFQRNGLSFTVMPASYS
jgi:hypothetical protein